MTTGAALGIEDVYEEQQLVVRVQSFVEVECHDAMLDFLPCSGWDC